MGTTQGWNIEKRRAEIRRIVDHIVQAQGMSIPEAHDMIARRFGRGINTIQGWVSVGDKKSRSPPSAEQLDILRYELTLEPVLDIVQWSRSKMGAKSAPAVRKK